MSHFAFIVLLYILFTIIFSVNDSMTANENMWQKDIYQIHLDVFGKLYIYNVYTNSIYNFKTQCIEL